MKKYLYIILFFLVCVPAIAGTINSYTLKSPPDDADTIVIYDSDDGSTKKIEVGDISSAGATDSGWTDGGTNVSTITSTDNVGIGTSLPDAKLTVKNGVIKLLGTAQANSININNIWDIFHTNLTLDYLLFRPTQTDTAMRLALMANGTVGGTANTLISGLKLFGTTNSTDLTDSCDFGMYMTSSGMRFNTKYNGSCPAFPINFGRQDTLIDMTIDTSGNVGIGTTLPVEKFQVATGAGQSIRVDSTPNTSTGGSTLKLSTNPGAAISAGSRVGSIFIQGAQDASGTIGVGATMEAFAGSTYSGTNLETYFRWRTASSGSTTLTERMRLSSDGNVGIGTISPVAKLEVDGLILPDKVTADPCTAGQEGAIFYNNTSNYWCGCNGTDDVKLTDNTTACF